MLADAPKIALPQVSADAPVPALLSSWLEAQQELAQSTNLALVTLDGQNSYHESVANDTSICQTFSTDPVKARMCAEYCGRARERALAAGKTLHYRCEANLHSFATPLETSPGQEPTALLGGRVFLSSREYREFLQREQEGGETLKPALFSNLKFSDTADFENSCQFVITAAQQLSAQAGKQPVAFSERPSGTAGHRLSGVELETFYQVSFEQGCREAMRLVGERFPIKSGALLMRDGQRFVACTAGGDDCDRLIDIHLSPDSPLLVRLFKLSPVITSVMGPMVLTDEEIGATQLRSTCTYAEAFPLFIGDELCGILLVLDTPLDAATQQEILRLGESFIVPLELARLRDEVHERAQAVAQWQDFAHLLATRSNASDTYAAIIEKVVAALGAERISLFVLQEESQRLVCKAFRGLKQDALGNLKLGEGITGAVMERGEPLLVRDLSEFDWVASLAHRNSSADSFISFPLQSGGRRLAVLNLTERAGGQHFDASDLAWLKSFAPYAAAALEQIELREKANRFQLLAITDPLTGLLNRRYLEERFAEELERSKRYQYPLSFAMIDIDSFKSFNDTFGHQAGDEVLRATAHCIRGSLRNFDVAARYGGEEFILVLPETDLTSAVALAERLRKQIEEHFSGTQSHRPLTVSIGIAGLNQKLHSKHQIIRAADQALYAAKKRGKNCVVVYNAELDPDLA